MERGMHDKEDMEEKGMHEKGDMEDKEDMEEKSMTDLATGHVEEGGAGRMDGGHDQLDSNFMAKYDEQSTLDLSPENLEKAYAQFKAEELEKMAFETVRNNFQSRLEAEMVAKSQEIEKSQYDAQAEVMQLRKQFRTMQERKNSDGIFASADLPCCSKVHAMYSLLKARRACVPSLDRIVGSRKV